MIAPGILVITSPLIFGVLFGIEALAGMLAGAIGVGVVMAISSSNSGGAWDNAKKYIETGVHGGKGSETHKAAVVGDTVGDPMKDTSGPSLNILMKLMAIISLVFIGMAEVGCIITSGVLIAEQAPDRIRGSVIGIFTLTGAVGILVASVAGGLLFDHWMKTGPFVLFGIAAALVLLWAMALLNEGGWAAK